RSGRRRHSRRPPGSAARCPCCPAPRSWRRILIPGRRYNPTMRYRQLGSSDLQVSEIALGSWLTYGGGVERSQAEACVAAAFEVGITFFDATNVYALGSAASFLGEVLSGGPRPCSRRSSTSRCTTRASTTASRPRG